jgi:hypothetical protein
MKLEQKLNNNNNNFQAPEIKQITVKINFKMPVFHKSIATPDGELYLTGGTIPDASMTKSGFIY